PRHRPIIDPAFKEQSKGVAAAAIFADALASLGSEPQRNSSDRLNPHARSHFPAAATDFGGGPQTRRDLACEIVIEPGPRLASAERAAGRQRLGAGDAA